MERKNKKKAKIKKVRKPLRENIKSTGMWVLLYTIFYMVLTVFFCLPRLLVQIVPPETAASLAAWLGESCTSGIPLEIFAWTLLAICAGYAGVDRAVMATKSSMMEIGSCDMGDPAKIRKVIYMLFAVFVENVALNFVFGRDLTIPLYDASGEVINTGEKRMVLHQLTRGQLGKDVNADGVNKREFYIDQQKKIFADGPINDIYNLLENGTVSYIVYTGAVMDSSVGDFRQLHRKAMNLRIPCMTSIDTAMALADVVSAHYSQKNTCLIDINR